MGEMLHWREDLSYLAEKQNLKNINQNTKMTVKTITAWREYHNRHFDYKCPEDLLEAADSKLLDKWLSTFIMRIRRADSNPYRPPPHPMMLDNILSPRQCYYYYYYYYCKTFGPQGLSSVTMLKKDEWLGLIYTATLCDIIRAGMSWWSDRSWVVIIVKNNKE